MRIFLGDKSKFAMSQLGIDSFPFTEATLKSKFRGLIKRYHEDTGGNKRKAQEIIAAYNHLKNLASIEIETNTINKKVYSWWEHKRDIPTPEAFNPVIPKNAVLKGH